MADQQEDELSLAELIERSNRRFCAIEKQLASSPQQTAGVSMAGLTVLVEGITETVKSALAKRDERIEALEKMLERYDWVKSWVDELSRRPRLQYTGTWKKDSEYGHREGEFVTHDGSVWYCKTYTKEEPGASPHWQLAVKRASPR